MNDDLNASAAPSGQPNDVLNRVEALKKAIDQVQAGIEYLRNSDVVREIASCQTLPLS